MDRKCILCLSLLLCGCMRVGETTPSSKAPEIDLESQKEKTTMTCRKDDDKVVFEAKGEEITKMDQIFWMSPEDWGLTEDMDKESILVSVNDSLHETYKDLKGVSAQGEWVDDKIQVTVTIDYKNADQDQLIRRGLLTEGERDSLIISLEETEKNYREEGYVCRSEE